MEGRTLSGLRGKLYGFTINLQPDLSKAFSKQTEGVISLQGVMSVLHHSFKGIFLSWRGAEVERYLLLASLSDVEECIFGFVFHFVSL